MMDRKELALFVKRRAVRLAPAYRSHGHERLSYHPKQVVYCEAPDLPEKKLPQKLLSAKNKRRRLSTQAERSAGIGLYTQHLTVSTQSVRAKLTETPRREEDFVAKKIQYGEDRELEAKCKAIEFTPTQHVMRCWQGQQTVVLSEGCESAAARLLPLKEAQMRKMYRRFRRIDADNSGSVSLTELLEYMDAGSSPFVRVFVDHVVFDCADLDKDGFLNFGEFMLATTTICCLSKNELLAFLFKVFDSDASGEIERAEFNRLSEVADHLTTLHKFEHFDNNDDGAIDFEEFVRINERFPMLFFPAAKIQDAFRRRTFSVAFWLNKAEKFAKRNNGLRFHAAIAQIARRIYP